MLEGIGAFIHLEKFTSLFFTNQAIGGSIEDLRYIALRTAVDGVTLAARASMLVELTNDVSHHCEGMPEGNLRLLLNKGICLKRKLVELKIGYTSVSLTHFLQ